MFSQMSQDDTVRDMVRIESWKKCRLNTIFFIWNFYWAKIVLVLQKKVCLASHNNHPTSLASSWDISFLKSLVQQDPKGSNKVARLFILDVYVSPNRKYVNLSLIYYILDFSFFMSQDDAHFHIHQNDPFVVPSSFSEVMYLVIVYRPFCRRRNQLQPWEDEESKSRTVDQCVEHKHC